MRRFLLALLAHFSTASVVLAGTPTSLCPAAFKTKTAIRADGFATAVPAGDVDGDGLQDLLFVGLGDNKIFTVLYGGGLPRGESSLEDPFAQTTIFTAENLWEQGAFFLPTLFGTSDLNGDGRTDLVLGTLFTAANPEGQGESWHAKVFIAFGSPELPGAVVKLGEVPSEWGGTLLDLEVHTESALQAGGVLHTSRVLSPGDFNGDGFQDCAFFMPPWAPSHLVLLFGGAQWPAHTALSTLVGSGKALLLNMQDLWGDKAPGKTLLVHAGDLDQDGHAELAFSLAWNLLEGNWNGAARAESWILWGTTRTAELQKPWSDLAAAGAAAKLSNLVLTDSAGDMDGDGYPDLAGFTLAPGDSLPNPSATASKGLIIYGGSRETWLSAGDLSGLEAGRDYSLLPALPSTALLYAPGLRWVTAREDLLGDALPDIVVGNPSLNVKFAEHQVLLGGEILVVPGRKGRPKIFSPNIETSYLLQGLDREERLGSPLFVLPFAIGGDAGPDPVLFLGAFASVDNWGTLRLPIIEGFTLWAIDLRNGPGDTLTVQGWERISSHRILLRGTGFFGKIEVFFGDSPASDIEVISPCAAFATAPPGEAGEMVEIVVRRGSEEITLKRPFVYPERGPTKTVTLEFLVAAGRARRFTFDAAFANARGFIPAGDMNGDGLEELAFERDNGDEEQIVLLPYKDDLPPIVDALSADIPGTVLLRPEGGEFFLGTPIASGDLTGDGLSDLVCTGRSKELGWCLVIIFGRTGMQDRVEVSPGNGCLLLRPEDPSAWGIPDVQLFSDIDADGAKDLGFCVRQSHFGNGSVACILYGGPELTELQQLLFEAFGQTHDTLVVTDVSYLTDVGDLQVDGVNDLGFYHKGQLRFMTWGERILGLVSSTDLHSQRGFASSFALDGFLAGADNMAAGPADVNGDGMTDIIISKYSFIAGPGGPGHAGAVGFFTGDYAQTGNSFPIGLGGAFPAEGAGVIHGTSRYVLSGLVASAGDLNSDGRSDFFFLCLDSRIDPQYPGRNVAGVLLGDPTLISSFAGDVETLGGMGIVLEHRDSAGAYFTKLFRGFDLNRDGVDDLVVRYGPSVILPALTSPVKDAYIIHGSREPFWDFGEPLFIRGDANTDAAVNIADAVSVLSFLFAGRPGRLTCPDAADANDDGKLNIADAVSILQFLFGGGPVLPAPGGICGPDKTKDELGPCFYRPCFDL